MLRFAIDGQKYEFDQGRVMNVEAIAIKRVTSEHLGFVEWLKAVGDSDVEAITALVWIVRKRIEPELRFSEVEFNVMEFIESLEMDEEPDAEPDPTASTPTPEPGSQPSPTTSESGSGSSTA